MQKVHRSEFVRPAIECLKPDVCPSVEVLELRAKILARALSIVVVAEFVREFAVLFVLGPAAGKTVETYRNFENRKK